jgi:hypothetical protein
MLPAHRLRLVWDTPLRPRNPGQRALISRYRPSANKALCNRVQTGCNRRVAVLASRSQAMLAAAMAPAAA